jgi:hypothetical protein
MTERFTLLSEIGRGGMGVVWKARDEETGQIVALKLLREAYAEDPEYLARFERELELAKRIYSANVVQVLGYGMRGKVPYLALEYIDGPSLHDALAEHGPYSWPETRALLIELAQGLADANAAGVIHRDVKPSNVLLAPDGTAKLTDFGIARGLDTTRMTSTSTMLGTPAYLAPEGPRDARSDLYSLGVIGYQLLTGAVPFKGKSHQEVIFEHVMTPPDLSLLPAEAKRIIGWLLAKDPDQRPQRASALLPVLFRAAEVPASPNPRQQAGAPSRPTPPPTRSSAAAPSPLHGRQIALGVGALCLVLVLVLAAAGVVLAPRTASQGPTATDAPAASQGPVGAQSLETFSPPVATAAPITAAPPATPGPTTVMVNREFTDGVGTMVTLTKIERLESGQIRFTFALQNTGSKTIYWMVNTTEYVTTGDGQTLKPVSWGDASNEYRVGDADSAAIARGAVATIWELYPPLPDPTLPFTCHTDGQVFDGLTL